jgi:hypothetical protein
MCDQCQALAAENAALQGEVKRLQQENKRLRARLKVIRDFVERVLNILSQRSGVPRGKWAYTRGADAVASRVLGMMK